MTEPRKRVRVAIYTRKSLDRGLERECNSLATQRKAAEDYVASQRSAGWEVLPERYDDGGFTGATLDRPAFRQLLADVEAGRVDVVAVYKIDRLSRSLTDFVKVIEQFEAHGVAFVSVTQHFSTADSMGRLTLNILASFAQFERDMIAERVRDSVVASRKKGLWVGVRCVLGYRVEDRRLVPEPDDAERVRATFRLYLELGSLTAVVAELDRRAWRTKRTITKTGITLGGKPFSNGTLRRLLTDSLYIGKNRINGEVLDGTHEAIVDDHLWEAVQDQLQRNGGNTRGKVRKPWLALLKGLLHCSRCGRPYTLHTTTRRGRTQLYYACLTYRSKGAKACPGSCIRTHEVDAFVVNAIREIGKSPELIAETLRETNEQFRRRGEDAEAELKAVERELAALQRVRRRLVASSAGDDTPSPEARAELERVDADLGRHQRRRSQVRSAVSQAESQTVDLADVRRALGEFDSIWAALNLHEQSRLMQLLVSNITYDAVEGDLAITLRSAGLRLVAEEDAKQAS